MAVACLRLYSKVPPNGLVLYCGTIVTDEGKEKKMNLDVEPFKPINTSLYLCDNKFHTEVRPPLALPAAENSGCHEMAAAARVKLFHV